MREQDLREGLWVAVLAEPALSFDPDTVMLLARRQAARRRALVGAGAATVAVAVAAIAVPTVLGTPGGSDGVSVGPGPATDPSPPPPSTGTAPPSATPVPWPPPKLTPVHYTAAQLKARGAVLQKYLKDRVPVLVPGAQYVTVLAFSGATFGSVKDGENSLNTSIAFLLNDFKATVSLSVFAPGAGPAPATVCGPGCEVVDQPDGSHLVTTRISVDDGMWEINAVHYRTNGAVVRVGGYNYDPSGDTAGPTMVDTPVAIAQLAAVAVDPNLAL